MKSPDSARLKSPAANTMLERNNIAYIMLAEEDGLANFEKCCKKTNITKPDYILFDVNAPENKSSFEEAARFGWQNMMTVPHSIDNTTIDLMGRICGYRIYFLLVLFECIQEYLLYNPNEVVCDSDLFSLGKNIIDVNRKFFKEKNYLDGFIIPA